MKNLYLHKIFIDALNKSFPNLEIFDVDFEIPRDEKFGDLSTNIAMKLSKILSKAPREIATTIINNLEHDKNLIHEFSIAGAGFINIKFTENYYQQELLSILQKGDDYGKTASGKNKKVNVEYVSANPTGLLHLGHGRNAAIGDTLANLYLWTGWDVTREYYFNNAGNQMNNLTNSIYARYIQQLQDENFPFPEDGYHGEYVKTIATELIKIYNHELLEKNPKNLETIKKFGEKWCFEKIKNTLNRMQITQDIFFNEDSLYSDGKISELLEEFEKKDLSYKKDGATWLALSKLGLESDRVIVKSTGEPTYRLPDIAYHRDKLNRGYDLIVDIFGSDHIATVPDVLAGVEALGFSSEKVKVIIHQFVTLTENGEQVKMSKRTGKSYTLDELLDDVGEDVVRYFLIMRGVNTHLEFDLSMAREQSDKNPVFYLQYAHARICSIFEKINNLDITPDNNSANININNINTNINIGEYVNHLIESAEIKLIKNLMLFPDIIQLASDKSEPHILCEYLRDVATAFHNFYHNCRIIGIDNNKLIQARLYLCKATKTVLSNGMKIIGVSAPDRM